MIVRCADDDIGEEHGLHLYASAQATELASDGDSSKNGVFTEQLLAGIKGQVADQDNDGFISIVELGDFAKDKTMAATTAGKIRRGGRLLSLDGLNLNAEQPTQTPVVMHFGKDAALVKVGL